MDGDRLPDEVVLGMVARRLSDATDKPWHATDGMVKGSGSVAIVLGEDHTGNPGHLDLDFVLNVDQPEDTTISDCVAGYGGTPEETVDRAIQIWLDTTGSALLELLSQDGSFAGHFAPDAPDGFPGWHAIHGGITGWGTGDDFLAVQHWAVDHPLLSVLAPVLGSTFDRDHLIGIKAFFGGGKETETAEIRVNGVHHEAASEMLADLDWPRPVEGLSYARTFLLLVHNETM
ncbi:DUF6348 family protein [Nonomuraea guangzhouensis]|uniref:DUF6348 family protein n=1 Tax=Nonomuraea guangzhouensis TaxID=1291555 RepID=A0ABW4GUC7_9ACTN|nr:DUF6348 family protein [Nonomuraea guangzhouensis]